MKNKAIELFKEALDCARNEFYIESINSFNKLIRLFPNSDLVDDAYFNIGLCYFEMNHFEQAIDSYNIVINDYPDSTISDLELAEFGKTAAKCHYAILNCYLALNLMEDAKRELEKAKKYENSFVINKGKEISFYILCQRAIQTYTSIK